MSFGNVLRSELIKLRTTRTFLWLVVIAVSIVALISLSVALLLDSENGDILEADLVTLASITVYFAFVLGVLAVSTEFRHGTIAPSLLAVPNRAVLLTAKLVSHFVAGILIAAAGIAAIYVFAGGIGALRGIESELFSSEVPKYIAGVLIGSGLFSALGVGLGAAMRNQVAAIAAGLGFIFIVEPLLTIVPTLGDWILDYGVGMSSDLLMGSTFAVEDPALSQVEAGLLFFGYTLIVCVIGFIIFRRRDVTA